MFIYKTSDCSLGWRITRSHVDAYHIRAGVLHRHSRLGASFAEDVKTIIEAAFLSGIILVGKAWFQRWCERATGEGNSPQNNHLHLYKQKSAIMIWGKTKQMWLLHDLIFMEMFCLFILKLSWHSEVHKRKRCIWCFYINGSMTKTSKIKKNKIKWKKYIYHNQIKWPHIIFFSLVRNVGPKQLKKWMKTQAKPQVEHHLVDSMGFKLTTFLQSLISILNSRSLTADLQHNSGQSFFS